MIELTIIGYLGKDPEARYTQNGTLVCHFSVASTRKVNNKEQTTWVEVTAWDKIAEACHQHLTKGSKVFVRGIPAVEAFSRKNGEPGASLKLTAQTVQFLGGSGKGTSGIAEQSGVEDYAGVEEEPPF